MTLAELEKRTQHKFSGPWRLAEELDSLHMPGVDREFLDRPATRPQITSAIAELGALLGPAANRN